MCVWSGGRVSCHLANVEALVERAAAEAATRCGTTRYNEQQQQQQQQQLMLEQQQQQQQSSSMLPPGYSAPTQVYKASRTHSSLVEEVIMSVV